MRASVAGQDWRIRAVLIPILGYYLFRHLGDFDYEGIYGGLNLAIHEAGHPLFFWFGNETLTAAGGTILEILCPVFAGIMFYRQRDVFGMTVALFWLGTTFLDAAPYAADARAQVLPLVTIGDGPVGHDWFNMLYRFDLLQYDQQIAGALRLTGLTMLAGAILSGVWVLMLMREEKSASASSGLAPASAVRGSTAGGLGLGAEEARLRERFSATGELRPDASERRTPAADSRDEKRKGLGIDAENERLRRRFGDDLPG